MQEQKQKKKPIRLQWEGELLNSTSEEPVQLKNKQKPSVKSNLSIKKITGKVSIRTEKKGRAGSPVSILYNFSSPDAKNLDNLKSLCSELKTKLACGGTVENGEIILMIRDLEKLKNGLQKLSINC